MIRPWQPEDFPTILVIETLTQITPWSEETFQRCFILQYQGQVIEHNNRVIGFVVASLQVGECHILNICIHPDYQGQGYGKTLLLDILQQMKDQRAGIAYLEVRYSNAHAIRLYQQLGFSEIGRRKEYYAGPKGREDALILAMDLIHML